MRNPSCCRDVGPGLWSIFSGMAILFFASVLSFSLRLPKFVNDPPAETEQYDTARANQHFRFDVHGNEMTQRVARGEPTSDV